MLVLTRNVEETIVIGGQIRVTVLSIGKGKVRLGISAPNSIRVDREEVHNRDGRAESTIDWLRTGGCRTVLEALLREAASTQPAEETRVPGCTLLEALSQAAAD